VCSTLLVAATYVLGTAGFSMHRIEAPIRTGERR
jgi:hypothetical protein